MPFINPLELLELGERIPELLDKTTIRSAKRRVLAELELSSDQTIPYKNLRITRSDVEAAADELESPDKLKAYHTLAKHPALNNFLVSGSEQDFYALEQITLPSDRQLLTFIGPPFAEKADRLLVKAYHSHNERLLQKIATWKQVLPGDAGDRIFSGIAAQMSDWRRRADNIAAGIEEKNGTVSEQQAREAVHEMQAELRPQLLNALPADLESARSALAMALRDLSVKIFNTFDNAALASAVITPARELRTDLATKEKIDKDYQTVSKISVNRTEQEKHGPAAQQYRAVADQLASLITWAEDKSSIPDDFPNQVRNLINVYELNGLPPAFEEVRDQIALQLRSLSVTIWNTHTQILPAMAVMDLAMAISVSADVRKKLNENFEQLRDLQRDVSGHLICFFCGKTEGDKTVAYSKRIYKEISRSYFPTRKVQYHYKDIAVPRCANCAALHKEGNGVMWMYIGIAAVVGGIIGFFAGSPAAMFGGLAVFALIGWGIGAAVKSNHAQRNGIRSTGESNLRDHPVIQSHIREGWGFNQPTA